MTNRRHGWIGVLLLSLVACNSQPDNSLNQASAPNVDAGVSVNLSVIAPAMPPVPDAFLLGGISVREEKSSTTTTHCFMTSESSKSKRWGPCWVVNEERQLVVYFNYVDGVLWGPYVLFDVLTGRPSQTGSYVNGQIHGEVLSWHSNGKCGWKWTEFNGKREGEFAKWDESGRILEIGNYKMGKRHGDWVEYDENGSVIRHEVYDSGRLIDTRK